MSDGAVSSVLIIHQCDGPRGGAERYLQILGRGLAGAGIRVSVLLTGQQPFVDELVPIIGESANPLICAPGRISLLAISRTVRHNEPQLLHWNFSDPFAFEGGLLAALPWGRPSVATDHLPMLRAGPHREIPRALVNRLLRRIIVVGDVSRQAAEQRWGRGRARWVVVRNGVDLPPAVPPRSSVLPMRLLFVGRLEVQKNPRFAVAVARELNRGGEPVALTVVGSGSQEAEVSRAAREAGVAATVLGRVEDPGPIMADADVLIAPSRYEGLPFVPLEAAVRSLPSVVSDIPPHRELARMTPAVVLAPGSSEVSWAATVRDVAARRRQIGEAALASRDSLSASRMIADTRAVYHAAVHANP